MADYVVRRVRSSPGRFGVFRVRGERHLYNSDFACAKEAFDYLRRKLPKRKVLVSRTYSNWLVYIA
jgi:hypothetical protein